MKKLIIFISILFCIRFQLLSQPLPTEYFYVVQEDSTYYLLSDKALFKFYSHEASGDFFLTNYIEDNFTASTKVALNDQHLFIANNDTLFYYSNTDPWDLTLIDTYFPGYPITSVNGFGPYFFIRSGNYYNLLKIENEDVVTVEDTLFIQPGNNFYVFFTYPFVVIGCTVYKYVEGFDFYAVHQLSGCANTKMGINGNKIYYHIYWTPPFPPPVCKLIINTIEEPSFPHTEINNWGINVPQIHNWSGHIIPKQNLFYFTANPIVLNYYAGVEYIPSSNEVVNISDYYIFLLGDSVQYSRWNQGSTFYPLTWVDLTSVQSPEENVNTFYLSQNYPNPFNPTTSIEYAVSSRQFVSLKVYDVLGNKIATLVNEEIDAGNYQVEWNASNLPSGIYFYKLRAGSIAETKKLILLK